MKMIGKVMLTILFSVSLPVFAEVPKNYIYTSSDKLNDASEILKRNDIDGAQIVYSWRTLEPQLGRYDFSQIEKDLAQINVFGKKLFIQIQDRSLIGQPYHVPDYLMTDVRYNGGILIQSGKQEQGDYIGSGWVAQQWNPAVRGRYQALLAALATRFDGKVYGVNLPETAIDIDMANSLKGFTCDTYFAAEIKNAAFARKVFKKSYVVQYINLWPCEWDNDRNYMGRFFEFARARNIGLGGPDLIPHHQVQMSNTYPFFNQYKNDLLVVTMAVQEPSLIYKNPDNGKPFTRQEFVTFAQEYLGTDIIFWSTASPWLAEKVNRPHP